MTNGKTQASGFQTALLKNSLWPWGDTSPAGHSFFSCKARAGKGITSKSPLGRTSHHFTSPSGEARQAQRGYGAESSPRGVVIEITPQTAPFSLLLYFISPSLSPLSLANHETVKLSFSLPALQLFRLLLRRFSPHWYLILLWPSMGV